MEEENNPEKRLLQEKIAKMLRNGVLETSDIENGEPIFEVTDKGLKKLEEEISEQKMDEKEIIAILISRFSKSDSNYGVITNIEGNVQSICDFIRDLIYQKRLDIYTLKFGDKIFLSRTNLDFENIQETIKRFSKLIVKRDMIELWDDDQNRILHLLINPLRKHFPISYKNEKNRLEIIERLNIQP